jgi:peptidoglycan/LPS O-acetylase OafA/YrhL
MNNKKAGYRPDIDGLRAVAVLAVIANHLPGKFLASGFLGVDVFFVISGFVVSASLLSQEQTTFSGFYSSFLSRRVKRLMPALIACVAITCVAVFLVDPSPRDSIITGISAVFGVANITLFNFALDYFSPSSKFNAFTHTWSLGVEEQFYIAFPLITWFTSFARTRSRGLLAAAITLSSLLSVYLFMHLYKDHQDAAYYLMPMRFWELGIGVLAYLSSSRLALPRFNRFVQLTSPTTVIALFLCLMVPQEHATWSTALSVGFTALLLFNTRRGITSRLLSLPPVVYVGKISYSLYLWHWPIVSLAPMAIRPDLRHPLLYIAAISSAATLSFHFIEKPLRVATWSRSNVRDIATAFACSFALGLTAILTLHVIEPMRAQRLNTLYPTHFLVIPESGLNYRDTCIVDELRPLKPTTFDQCTIPPASGSGMPTIWSMGDSHAAHLQAMLYEVHRIAGFGVHSIATPGHFFPDSHGNEFPPRQELFDKALERLKPGDIVLVSRFFLSRTTPESAHWDIPLWVARTANLASVLEDKQVTLIVTGPPPAFRFNDLRECNIAAREYCAVSRAELAPVIDSVLKQLYTLQDKHKNVRVFDIFAQICPPDAQLCYPDDGVSFLFRDRDHLNSLGATRLARPFMDFLNSSGTSM